MELADLKNSEKNRKRIDNTIEPYPAPLTPSYIYDRLNENTYSNTTSILPPRFDTSIQTQSNSASYASVGANDVASYVLDKCTNLHGNKDVKDIDFSQSYYTPKTMLFFLFW